MQVIDLMRLLVPLDPEADVVLWLEDPALDTGLLEFPILDHARTDSGALALSPEIIDK